MADTIALNPFEQIKQTATEHWKCRAVGCREPASKSARVRLWFPAPSFFHAVTDSDSLESARAFLQCTSRGGVSNGVHRVLVSVLSL